MKKNFIFFAVVTAFIFSCAETVIVPDVKGSNLENMNTEETKDSILIIDTRPYSAYKISHVPDAINIPKDEIKKRINEFADWKNKPIYIYADNDDDSFDAARIFVAAGCKTVYNAEGISQYTYKTVTYDSMRGIVFEQKINSPDVLIVDCRLKKYYDEGHIEGAISIPITEIEQNLSTLPKDKKLFLYCSLGSASARAALVLSENGFTEIYNTIDGTSEYPFKLVKDTE